VNSRSATPLTTGSSQADGHGRHLRAARPGGTAVARSAPEPWSCLAFPCINPYKKWLLGKRSASGRRRKSGSGGQATDLAEAIHRLVLWVGGLSTAGVSGLHRRSAAISRHRALDIKSDRLKRSRQRRRLCALEFAPVVAMLSPQPGSGQQQGWASQT
jgi:hypothetical protein